MLSGSKSGCRICRASLFSSQRQVKPLHSIPAASRKFSNFLPAAPRPVTHSRSRLIFAHIPTLRSNSIDYPGTTSIFTSYKQRRYASTHNPSLVNEVNPTQTYVNLDPQIIENVDRLNETGGWKIGYLKEAGLDFGWGPSNAVMWLFEHLHVYDGLSIAGTVLLTAGIIRVGLFGLALIASEQSARMRQVQHLTAPVTARMREAALQGDRMKRDEARRELSIIHKSANISIPKMFLPFVQLPIGFGIWRVYRGMASAGVDGLSNGGFLWFQNLAVPDPFMGLPLMMGIFQHLSVRLGGETGSNDTMSKAFRPLMLWILPIIGPFVVLWAPAIVQMSFFFTSFFAVISGLLIRNPTIRRLLGYTLMELKSSRSSSAPRYGGTMTLDATARVRKTGSTANTNPTTVDASNSKGLAARARSAVAPLVDFAEKKGEEWSPGWRQKGEAKHAAKVHKSRSTEYEKKRKREIEAERKEFEEMQRREFPDRRPR